NATGRDKVLETVGDLMVALGSVGDYVVPEGLEDCLNLVVTAANWPAEKSQAWRIETMLKSLNGEDLSAEEEAYVQSMIISEQAATEGKDLPFGIGWAWEKGENVIPMDLEWWIIRNPERAQDAYAEGGPRMVWDTYQEETTSDTVLGGALSLTREASN